MPILEHEYHYVYKTVCLLNDKYYYGVHSTNNLEDNYKGSGIGLKEAFRKYGKSNFETKILLMFDTRGEASDFEALVVNEDVVKDSRSYNRTYGGAPNPIHCVWGSPDAAKIKVYLSELSKGYINPAFIHDWKDIYDELAPVVVFYLVNTNLPDYKVAKLVKKRYGHSLKITKLIDYYKYLEYLEEEEKISYVSYFSAGIISRNIVAKTKFKTDVDYCTDFIDYKGLDRPYLGNLEEVISYLLDDTLSDSLMYNVNKFSPSFGYGINSRLSYYEYLGVLTKVGSKKIDIRVRFPGSHRKWGTKTIYKINKGISIDFIDMKESFNEYKGYFDGRSIQISEVRLPRYDPRSIR